MIDAIRRFIASCLPPKDWQMDCCTVCGSHDDIVNEFADPKYWICDRCYDKQCNDLYGRRWADYLRKNPRHRQEFIEVARKMHNGETRCTAEAMKLFSRVLDMLEEPEERKGDQ